MEYPKIDFLYLNEDDMVAAGVKDMKGCVDAMEEMFRLMKVGDYRMGGAPVSLSLRISISIDLGSPFSLFSALEPYHFIPAISNLPPR